MTITWVYCLIKQIRFVLPLISHNKNSSSVQNCDSDFINFPFGRLQNVQFANRWLAHFAKPLTYLQIGFLQFECTFDTMKRQILDNGSNNY